jgi:hypothetical protein
MRSSTENTYEVELTAKAFVRQRHKIVASNPEEAVRLAKDCANNHEWEYDGLTEDEIEGIAVAHHS